jgi:hypothetical protein
MIAPAIERAPRILLVIGEDEQGLPTETTILEPSVSRLYESLRAWLTVVLPSWLCSALALNMPSSPPPPGACGRALMDVRLRWAGL